MFGNVYKEELNSSAYPTNLLFKALVVKKFGPKIPKQVNGSKNTDSLRLKTRFGSHSAAFQKFARRHKGNQLINTINPISLSILKAGLFRSIGSCIYSILIWRREVVTTWKNLSINTKVINL